MRVVKDISKLKVNFIYNVLYQVLKMLIPLVTTPYIARVLGSEGTGKYSLAQSIAHYFVMFAMLGVNNYGNRSIAMVRDDMKEKSKKFWSIYLFQLSSAMVMIIMYIIYVLFFDCDSLMGWIMLLYVISAALDINWFFAGIEDFKLIVARNMAIQIFTVLCIFLFVKTPNDVYIYSFIYSLGTLIQQIPLWICIRNKISWVRVSKKDIIVHFKPILILFIPLIAISLYNVMDKIMLGWMSSEQEVGYYEVCGRICNLPSAVIIALGTVMLPRMAYLFAKKEEEKTEKYIENSIMLAMFFSSSMCFGMMAIADIFVPLYYGDGFEKCAVLFKILLPSSLFVAFANVIRTQYLIPKKKDNIFIISVFSGAAVNIFVNLIMIPRSASIGAAIGTLIAEMTVCIYQAISVYKEIAVKRYVLESMIFVAVGLIMYVSVSLFHVPIENSFILLSVKILVGVIVYLTGLGVIWGIGKSIRNRKCVKNE